MAHTFHVYAEKKRLIEKVAAFLLEEAKKAIENKGHFNLVLQGGKTPQALYEYLAEINFPWEKTFLFWGDERCVPRTNVHSNFYMVEKTLLSKIKLPHFFPMPTRPNESEKYEETLKNHFKGFPIFDVILLGIGEDGHMASLYPEHEALQEKEKWVVSVSAESYMKPAVPRLTLTIPVIQRAEKRVFLVMDKQEATQRVIKEKSEPISLLGECIWFTNFEVKNR